MNLLQMDLEEKAGSMFIPMACMRKTDPLLKNLLFGFSQDKVSPTLPATWADYTNPANGHFKGLLDDVAIYHSVLTQAMVTLMYNSGKP